MRREADSSPTRQRSRRCSTSTGSRHGERLMPWPDGPTSQTTDGC